MVSDNYDVCFLCSQLTLSSFKSLVHITEFNFHMESALSQQGHYGPVANSAANGHSALSQDPLLHNVC